ncbi:MAG: hypothetical protein EXR58_01000 [Chloroflexi bacterium]|nr:hypothetical protein [Chloroflexota bacterium]
MTSTPRRLFVTFAMLLATVVVGLVVLPGLTGDGPMSRLVANIWLAWMFALWGALVAVIVFLIAWLAEPMPQASGAVGAAHIAERGSDRDQASRAA